MKVNKDVQNCLNVGLLPQAISESELLGWYAQKTRPRIITCSSTQSAFLDEPTTGLDPTSRVALWEEVRTLNKEIGTTVFLTTQYLEEADQLAQRIAIIDNGRIVREELPRNLNQM